jgi:hypothetical protein
MIQEHRKDIDNMKQYVLGFATKFDEWLIAMMSSIEKYIEETKIDDNVKEQIIMKMHDEYDIFRNKLT